MTRWPPYQRTTMPASAVDEHAQGAHAQAELLQAEAGLDEAGPAAPRPPRPEPLGAESLDRLDAGDVLDQVRRQLRGVLHRARATAAGPPGGGPARPGSAAGTKAVATSGQRQVVASRGPPAVRTHERAVDDRRQRRAADGLADLGGVVDPREDLADLPHLEERATAGAGRAACSRRPGPGRPCVRRGRAGTAGAGRRGSGTRRSAPCRRPGR